MASVNSKLKVLEVKTELIAARLESITCWLQNIYTSFWILSAQLCTEWELFGWVCACPCYVLTLRLLFASFPAKNVWFLQICCWVGYWIQFYILVKRIWIRIQDLLLKLFGTGTWKLIPYELIRYRYPVLSNYQRFGSVEIFALFVYESGSSL